MPADILGTNVIVEDERRPASAFEFQRGPVFANIVLADEINRATPKTQSALLEAMQEQHGHRRRKTTYQLEQPFFVLATQNPLEMEGTYPLPEAQLDRFFFKLKVGFPDREELHTIIDRTTSARRRREAEQVVDARRASLEMRELVRAGAGGAAGAGLRHPRPAGHAPRTARGARARHASTCATAPARAARRRCCSAPRSCALLDGRFARRVRRRAAGGAAGAAPPHHPQLRGRGRGRRAAVQVLFFDGTGMCQFYKRLDRGVFRLPEPMEPGATTWPSRSAYWTTCWTASASSRKPRSAAMH